MINANVGCIRDPLKQDLALEFYRNQNKDISILTESHINYDQIQHIKNNWLGRNFFSSGDCHTEGLLVLLHSGLERVTEVDTDTKGRFASFKVTPSMTEFFVFIPFHGIAPGNSWLEGVSFKNLKIIWKIKLREMKTKQNLEALTVLWMKWTGMVEVKYIEFIDVVPVMPCENPSWTMGSRIYGERKTHIPLSSSATIDPLAQDPG